MSTAEDNTSSNEAKESCDFDWSRHVKFFERTLGVLPQEMSKMDSQRMTIAFFGISGLDLLGALDEYKYKADIVDWIYSLQLQAVQSDTGIITTNHSGEGDSGAVKLDQDMDSVARASDLDFGSRFFGGFRGSQSNGHPYSVHAQEPSATKRIAFDGSHIAMTYTGLASLLALGDDLSRVDKSATLNSLGALQCSNGSFSATPQMDESDMRFTYCAACICYMLQDSSSRETGNIFPFSVDRPKAVSYILNSQTYEGGFAQGPGLEAHGGSTFCAVASLALLGELGCLSPKQKARLVYWCVKRQTAGYQGRPNKPEDTCYSFWIGSTLNILGKDTLTSWDSNRLFLLSTQDESVGGFSKWPSYMPDPFHSYLGVAALSLIKEKGVRELNPLLNISSKAVSVLGSSI